jgi:nucleotide-binding universal stress UspA family protein
MAGGPRMADALAMNADATPNVVCGLDDSEHAPVVLAAAAGLADRLRLPLTVVHSPSPEIFAIGERRRDLLWDAERSMARLIGDRDVELVVQPGPPAGLLRAALLRGAALGVVGSHGRGPIRGALIGSVSAELARSASCPVVVVPPGAGIPEHHEEPSIVCRVDISADGLQTLRAAAWITAALGGSRLAVNVRDRAARRGGTSVLAQIEHELDDLGLEAAIRVETGDPIDQLHRVADDQGATLIVVGAHGARRLRSWPAGGLSARLIAEARRPVMVVSPQASLPRRALAGIAETGT